MNKYGVENFTVELAKECSKEDIYDSEVALIRQLDSFNNGYNATLGGKGLKLITLSDRLICKIYYDTGSARKCAEKLNIEHPYGASWGNYPKDPKGEDILLETHRIKEWIST